MKEFGLLQIFLVELLLQQIIILNNNSGFIEFLAYFAGTLINTNLDAYKKIVIEKLCSPLGVELRKKQDVDVETVFGDMKNNQGFRKFNLQGFAKVNS